MAIFLLWYSKLCTLSKSKQKAPLLSKKKVYMFLEFKVLFKIIIYFFLWSYISFKNELFSFCLCFPSTATLLLFKLKLVIWQSTPPYGWSTAKEGKEYYLDLKYISTHHSCSVHQLCLWNNSQRNLLELHSWMFVFSAYLHFM